MKVLLFGMLAENIGTQEIEIDSMSDLDSLRNYLVERFPSLKNRQFIIAVNKQKADKNIKLKLGDEIALIPPFAGG